MDQADDVHEGSNAHQVPTHLRPRVAFDVKLSSYQELRAKAEEYKARSHRCTITEFLGGLRDQQQALLARARRLDVPTFRSSSKGARDELRGGGQTHSLQYKHVRSEGAGRSGGISGDRNSVSVAEETLVRATRRRPRRM